MQEVMLLGLEPGRTLTLEQKLAVWSSTHIPAKPVVTRKCVPSFAWLCFRRVHVHLLAGFVNGRMKPNGSTF